MHALCPLSYGGVMVPRAGVEPASSRLEGACLIQSSHRGKVMFKPSGILTFTNYEGVPHTELVERFYKKRDAEIKAAVDLALKAAETGKQKNDRDPGRD